MVIVKTVQNSKLWKEENINVQGHSQILPRSLLASNVIEAPEKRAKIAVN